MLTGPEPCTGKDLARSISQFLCRDVQYEDMSSEQLRQQLMQSGMELWFVNGLVELMELFASGKVDSPTEDVRRIT
jgi:hypothetical protein